MHCKRISIVVKLNSSAIPSEIDTSRYTEIGWKMIFTDSQHALVPEWDTDVSQGKLDVIIRQIILKK